jgi:hypothetical protein
MDQIITTQPEISLKDLTMSIIALSGLLLSLWNSYYTQWKKPKLKIFDTGRCSFSINMFNSTQFAISPNLMFANTGARSGIIENLALKIQTGNKARLFIPIFEFLEDELNLARIPNKTLHSQDFRAFSLIPKEVISKKITFTPDDSAPFELQGGVHHIEILMKEVGGDFKTMLRYSFTVEANELQEHRRKIPVGFVGYVEDALFTSKRTSTSIDSHKKLHETES